MCKKWEHISLVSVRGVELLQMIEYSTFIIGIRPCFLGSRWRILCKTVGSMSGIGADDSIDQSRQLIRKGNWVLSEKERGRTGTHKDKLEVSGRDGLWEKLAWSAPELSCLTQALGKQETPGGERGAGRASNLGAAHTNKVSPQCM